MPKEYTLELDFGPLVEAMSEAVKTLGETMSKISAIAQPRPQREVRELRDIAREHNLDRADRGPARVRRADGALVAEWDDEELVRFREVVDDA